MIHAMRISLICNTLSEGGAGRVASLLANGFAADGWPVILMTTDDGAKERFFHLMPDVIHMPLSLEQASFSRTDAVRANTNRVRIIREAVLGAGSRLVISFLDRTNVLAILATRGSGIPVVVSERTDPAERNIGLPWKILRRMTYALADALVCQGQRPLDSFPQSIRRVGCIIPNPVIRPKSLRMGSPDARGRLGPYRLVAVGTLRPEKGFDLLVRAYACVVRDFPEWSLTIWGEGPERAVIDALRSGLGVSDRVRLPGLTQKPFSELVDGDLFVLSSRVEGFPNALAEAMAAGLPVIATDVGCVPDIVRNGLDGIIVRPGDVRGLVSAMGRLMGNGKLRCEMGSRAREVTERFGMEKVLTMWKDLIRKVVGPL